MSFGIHKNLVGKIGIIVEELGMEEQTKMTGEGFYLVSFDDRIVSVAEHQIVAAIITHTLEK